ncbi:MAG: flagellar hook-associated protein FlgK [Desulfatiglandaceae bacterium]|jgi:flagellar hook-associated protein 1 FlgK
MSGISLLLSTAKDALMTQQQAMDVIGHNVANVNTPDYSRQVPVIQANTPASYAGLIFGRGATVTEIQRNANTFIENSLQQRQSDLSATSEKEIYMGVLEGIFNENSGRSLSGQMADFWNAWHDLSNNPSGDSERSALYERGALLGQTFSDLSGDLAQLGGEMNLSIDNGVETINEMTAKIADLNEQIVSMSGMGNANDLIDQRQHLVNQLSEYLDVKYYVNDDNSMTVTTGKGYGLVSGTDSYSLSFDGNNVRWESSGAASTDITDTITGGKMGGWLDMRDTIIPEYNDKLNQLSGSLIREVNNLHAQGVGLERMTDVTGTYGVGAGNNGVVLANTNLDFGDSIDTSGTKSFTIWLNDGSGNNTSSVIDVDGGTDSLDDIVTRINSVSPGNLIASDADGKLGITTAPGFSFAFSDDTSGALAALGINTFFAGSNATDMKMNANLGSNKNLIAAGRVDATGQIASGDNTNALDMAGLQYADVDIKDSDGNVVASDTLDNYLAGLEGSIGIKSQSITRTREYNETIVNNLKDARNNVSAVSIDEEMTQLIKFQHAYAAAAKLISTADEMYQTLLDTKQ